jgi:hypothetical protein
MKNKLASDFVLEKLTELQKQYYLLYPLPYVYPSDNGKMAQLIADSIDIAVIAKNKAGANMS